MRNTRNKRKLAELQDNFDEDLSQGSSRERSNTDPNENYITQVSQEIEGRISKKLSQEFSKRESRILGALAKLDHFLTSSVNSACISTPNPKLTSVTGNQDLSPSDCHEREGHSLNGQQDRNRIPDPDEVILILFMKHSNVKKLYFQERIQKLYFCMVKTANQRIREMNLEFVRNTFLATCSWGKLKRT